MTKIEWLCAAWALIVGAAFQAPDKTPRNVTGVLLNAVDRKPLAEYTFILESTADPLSSSSTLEPGVARMERLTTDSAGRFRSAQPFPIRHLLFTPVDLESTSFAPTLGGLTLSGYSSQPLPTSKTRIDFKGDALEIPLPAGPTFDLVFKSFEIETTGPAIGASSARLIATTEGDIDEGVAMSTYVRTLDPMRGWVRFAALPADRFAKPHRARLEIVAADGRWKAGADVTEQLASGARRVELEWKACSRWSGTLRGIRTTPLAPNWISAERMSEDGRVLERRRIQVEHDGNFRFHGLEPGKWRVATRPLRTKPFTSEVRELDFERQVSEPIHLERIETKLVLGGVVHGPDEKSAVPPPVTRLILRRASEDLPVSEIYLDWKIEDEHFVAPFEFTELPEGEFDVEIQVDGGSAVDSFEKTSLRARAGGPKIEFSRR